MSNSPMYFLSYRRVQLYFAEALSYQLNAAGLQVWFDLQRLTPGSNWEEGIQRGLEECSGVILLASRAALESPYVEKEWRHALATGKPVYVVLFERVMLPPELQNAPIIAVNRSFPQMCDLLLDCIRTDRMHQDSITILRGRLIPLALRESALMMGLLLLVNALAFLLLGVAIALTSASAAPTHWLNILSRTAGPLGQPVLFLFIGVVLLGVFVRYWQRRGSMAALVLPFATIALCLMLSSVGVFLAASNPLFDDSRVLVRMLCILGVGLGLLNLMSIRMVWRGSPALVRWMATGGISAEYRQDIYRQLLGQRPTTKRQVQYSLEFAGEDVDFASAIRLAMQIYGHSEAAQPTANTLCLLVITPHLPPHRVRWAIGYYRLVIPILAATVDMQQYSVVKPYQIVDYRLHEPSILKAMAAYIRAPEHGGFELGSAVTPRALGGSSLLMLYNDLNRGAGLGNTALLFAKALVGCVGQVAAVLLCFCAGGFALSLFNLAATPNIPNSLNLPRTPVPTPLYTAVPRPTATPVPIQQVTLDGLTFDLIGDWTTAEDWATEPYSALLRDHEQGAAIWSAANDMGLWLLALRYPASYSVTTFWLNTGEGIPVSITTDNWRFGMTLRVDWVARKPRPQPIMSGAKEWLVVINPGEDADIILLHVLATGQPAAQETLPNVVLEFVKSLSFVE